MPASDYADIASRKGLVSAANLWAEKAKEKAKTQRIADEMTVGPVNYEGNGRYRIDITNTAPEAPAYEFGSGLRRTRGAPSTYPIEPHHPPQFLAFQWPKVEGETMFRRLPDGRVLLVHVEHPGVRPEPFMQPALEENKDEMRRMIGQAFMTEVVYKSIREIFKVD